MLENMNSFLAHCGPDGSGVYQDGALGIRYMRLAIIATGRGSLQLALHLPVIVPI